MQDFAISIGDRNQVVILNEYNGQISIISGYEGSDGKNYFNMVFPRDNRTKEARDKAIPQKVTLGDKDAAVRMLRQFIQALQPAKQPAQADEDAPF